MSDIDTMFNNTYIYNKPGEDIVVMAQALQAFYLTKVCNIPKNYKSITIRTQIKHLYYILHNY